MDVKALLQYRSERNAFLSGHYASPLPDEYRDGFEGLDCFEPDAAWVLTGRFEPEDDARIAIPSTANTTTAYGLVGHAVVIAAGHETRLAIVDDGDGGVFIPFRDATAGDSTYGGGRYVQPEFGDDGTVTIDFNRASNPWCVYDAEFTCPLPPPQNVLPFAIEAGEKVWTAPR